MSATTMNGKASGEQQPDAKTPNGHQEPPPAPPKSPEQQANATIYLRRSSRSQQQAEQRPQYSEKVEKYYRTSENTYRIIDTDPLDNQPEAEWLINYPKQLKFLINTASTNDYYDDYNREFRLKINVTGYKPEQIHVSTVDDQLIVYGSNDDLDCDHNHRDRYQSKEMTGYLMSREFRYKFRLPKYVDKSKMKCLFRDNGQLLIDAPIELPGTRHIPIRVLDDQKDSKSKDSKDGGQRSATPDSGKGHSPTFNGKDAQSPTFNGKGQGPTLNGKDGHSKLNGHGSSLNGQS